MSKSRNRSGLDDVTFEIVIYCCEPPHEKRRVVIKRFIRRPGSWSAYANPSGKNANVGTTEWLHGDTPSDQVVDYDREVGMRTRHIMRCPACGLGPLPVRNEVITPILDKLLAARQDELSLKQLITVVTSKR